MGILRSDSVDTAKVNSWKKYYSTYYTDHSRILIHSIQRARINDNELNKNAGDIAQEKREGYLYCMAYLESAIACHLYASDYAARSLCRTIIEICVKMNLKHPLDCELQDIPKNIEKTSWLERDKKMAKRLYHEGNKFVHLNPDKIYGILETSAEQIQGFEYRFGVFLKEHPPISDRQKKNMRRTLARAFSPTSTGDAINDTISVIKQEFLS